MPNREAATQKKKYNDLFYGIFVNIYVDLHILIQPYIQIYITHNTQQSHPHTPILKHTYLQITTHILAHAYIHTYIIL